MSILGPGSGDDVAAAGIIGMHEEVRTTVNSVGIDQIARNCFNDKHFSAGLLIACDHVDVTTAEVASEAAGHVVGSEANADIAINWRAFPSYLLDNSGAGYTLDPCKVLCIMTLRIGDFTIPGAGDDNYQFWFALVPTIDTVVTPRILDSGIIQGDDYTLQDEPVVIWFVLDQTGAGGTWTLDELQLYGAVNRGASPADGAVTAEVLSGTITMLAFYRDA